MSRRLTAQQLGEVNRVDKLINFEQTPICRSPRLEHARIRTSLCRAFQESATLARVQCPGALNSRVQVDCSEPNALRSAWQTEPVRSLREIWRKAVPLMIDFGWAVAARGRDIRICCGIAGAAY